MITSRYQTILTNINNYFEDNSDKEINEDLLKIFNYVIVTYSRNIFRYNGNWKKVERIYDFDYDYIHENDVSRDLLHMQKEYRRYAKLFDNSKINSKINSKNNSKITERDVESYRQFINDSIKIMITKIVIPMNEKYGCVRHLIKKYEYLKIEPKKPIRSNKLNYDAIEQLFGREFMIESGLLD